MSRWPSLDFFGRLTNGSCYHLGTFGEWTEGWGWSQLIWRKCKECGLDALLEGNGLNPESAHWTTHP